MSILITGANGFIGQALCKHLEEQAVKVIRAVRHKDVLSDLTVKVGEIGPDTDWQTILADVNPQVVIHLAARVHVMRDQSKDALAEFRQVNVAGTLRLAQQVAKMGCKRLIYLSSIKVNGEHTLPGQVFDNQAQPQPQDAYAISKFEAENVLWEFVQHSGMELVVIRPPLVYGPGVKGNFATLVSLVTKLSHRFMPLPLPLKAIKNKRSFLALDNLVDFIALCADLNTNAANQTFLLADGEDVSTPELLRRLGEAYNQLVFLFPFPEYLLQAIAKLVGKTEVINRLAGCLVVDSSRARNLLGWQPLVNMQQQLSKMANLEKQAS